ncbi:MAG: SPFH domain-containing protein [Elusimicrobiota bacterium]|jgi:membrane protease subunit (stomatin/prohibitin family)|nr:SPFH domain-containing protein [Elusimicrobiota bacterium]
MGLVKTLFQAGSQAINTVLADQWKEYFYCDALDANTLVKKGQARIAEGSANTKGSDNIITNGSKIAVNEGQFMIIVENGKIVDFTAEAGAYTYDTGTEPSLFDGGWKGLKESFFKVGKRFVYGGQPENDQRVYFINTKEIVDNKFGIGDVPFRDGEFGFTVKIKGYGVYSYRITNPVMFYTNVAANVVDSYKRDALEQQLKAEVQQQLISIIGKTAQKNISYDKIPLYAKEISQEVNKELSKDWNEMRGVQVVSVAFSSVIPDEESAKKINAFQEARVFTQARMMGARLGTAQAAAMENAASNEGGAMLGFLGMGFAAQAGGANAGQFFKQPEDAQTSGANPAQSQTPPNVWTCKCGTANTGNFCGECGVKKPEEVCKCGHKHPAGSDGPKFCPECGEKLK